MRKRKVYHSQFSNEIINIFKKAEKVVDIPAVCDGFSQHIAAQILFRVL